jgi:hypothetical protein
MANRSDALQSSRKSQCFSASVRTTWLYRSDAIQSLTTIRVSASRQSYGKMAATVRMMCDPVRTMSSIRQECAYQVQPSGRQPSWFGRSSFIYGNCVHQFNRPDISLQGPDTPSFIMVISCSRSATVRTLGQHRPDAALYGSFQCYFGKAVAVDRPDVRSSRLDALRYFGHNFLLKYRIGTKSASLEILETML